MLLVIRKVKNIQIHNIDLNINSIFNLDKFFIKYRFEFENIDNLIINKIKLSSFFKIINENIFYFEDINNVQINYLSIENFSLNSKLLDFNAIKNITLSQIQVRNCFYQQNLIRVYNNEVFQLLDSNFKLEQNYQNLSQFKLLQNYSTEYIFQKSDWLMNFNNGQSDRSLLIINQLENKNSGIKYIISFRLQQRPFNQQISINRVK
ncbi:hypothetical protein TTHERM_000041539 (macronuclear) [Tetrahymena thermophila SB210]|uniref:Uncharacterized protein n=1 Tax=Tetrahymena thermophila (strain SB210) TaxID=312017 RepID=W7XKH8_TETTS|nr:hypothetical protein TTHERM_000041539 [Tetrahymena thermophila SB210]EWS74914.1 hypothetical protein TTHERM_000041539 [Tetrahymena thermophila SB210]|eukprot:XP_012652627.1 hypothetical protein TTHERM_000041539 [Tetrahymena thermophila SB210]